MNSDAKFFKLGLFVIAGILLFVGGVVMLGAGEYFTKYVTMETATTDSVEGLDVGGAVKYSGVTVGKISKIQMAMWKYPSTDPAVMAQVRKYVWIEMSVRRDLLPAKSEEQMESNFKSAVDSGLRVRMASSGLTGPAFLDINFLDPKQYPAEPIPWTPDQLYLPSAPASMAQIVSSIESIVTELKKANVGETLSDGRKFIVDADNTLNALKIEELQKKAFALLDEANTSAREIHAILDDPNVKQTVADLPKITTPLKESLDRVDTMVHDPKLQKLIDDLGKTTASAAPTAEELRRLVQTLDQILDSRQRDLEIIITDLRRVLQNGDAVIEDAKSNPSRLILGEPPPHLDEAPKK